MNESRLRTRLTRSLVAAAVIGALTIGGALAAAPANAYYTNISGGRTGQVIAPAVSFDGSVAVFVPGVTVYRNGGAAWGQGQPVPSQTFLELYTASGWVTVDTLTQNLTITNTANAVTSGSYTMTPRYNYGPRTGYYRVTYNVIWRGPWVAVGQSPTTGYMGFVPNLASENRCGIAACSAAAGWLLKSSR